MASDILEISVAAPGPPGVVGLLRHAGAFSRLSRLATLVAARTNRDRETVIFDLLDDLRDHLDSVAESGRGASARNEADAVRAWFDRQIGCEEGFARDRQV